MAIELNLKAGVPVEFSTMQRQDVIRAGIFVAYANSVKGAFAKIRAENDVIVTTRPSLVKLAA